MKNLTEMDLGPHRRRFKKKSTKKKKNMQLIHFNSIKQSVDKEIQINLLTNLMIKKKINK